MLIVIILAVHVDNTGENCDLSIGEGSVLLLEKCEYYESVVRVGERN